MLSVPSCAFIDRDGVINRRIIDGYVLTWPEFEFLPGAIDALVALSASVPKVVIVTNQQGVGRGLMTRGSLNEIHAQMSDAVLKRGGRIDDILVCDHLASSNCGCRKPSAKLPKDWLAHHPDVDDRRTVVVGDADSDMEMARRLGLTTGGCTAIRIGESAGNAPSDYHYSSLADLAANPPWTSEDGELWK